MLKILIQYPYNGCRKKKFEEKNLKIKNKYMKKWLSGLRRQTVNLLSFLIVGSNPIFFKFILKLKVV
jgi:hypothetical protein